jgi:hypothetical protein
MKLWILVLTAILVASMQLAYAEAFKNEPADFRGVAWGAAYDDYADEMNLVRRDADVLVYIREEDQAGSGRDGYMKIAYRFYKDRFSAGIIQTYGNDTKKQLRRRLTGKHGEPVKVSRRQELFAWDGENVQIVLSCSVTSYCAAEFMSKEMIALEEFETGRPVQVLQKDDN